MNARKKKFNFRNRKRLLGKPLKTKQINFFDIKLYKPVERKKKPITFNIHLTQKSHASDNLS